ncbi:kinase-like domain-containing protein [Mycena amicta]|nr:kinase-like domain-containing protein [Mycena amicta]
MSTIDLAFGLTVEIARFISELRGTEKQLQRLNSRCTSLLSGLRDSGQDLQDPTISQFLDELVLILRGVRDKLKTRKSQGFVSSLRDRLGGDNKEWINQQNTNIEDAFRTMTTKFLRTEARRLADARDENLDQQELQKQLTDVLTEFRSHFATEREVNDDLSPVGASAPGSQTASTLSARGIHYALPTILPVQTSHELADGLPAPSASGLSAPPAPPKPGDVVVSGNLPGLINHLVDTGGDRGPGIADVSESINCDLSAVLSRLIGLLGDPESYKRFLLCRGMEAQQRLDLLQDLIDLDYFPDDKPLIIQALFRLCRASGRHPQCFALSGLHTVGQQVTGGGFGDIWKGLVHRQSVCVKVMRIFEDSNLDAILKEFGREAAIWGQLCHPNVLPFLGIYYLEKRLCLVSPWMEAGHIMKFITNTEPTMAERLSLILDVAFGLQYLHKEKIVHGDLKAFNVLVTPSKRGCIADFGLSTIANAVTVAFTHSTAKAQAGTARYQAPELFQEEDPAQIHYGSDVYAFACVCYEILTGKVPFHDLRNDMAVMMAVARGRRPLQPTSCSGTMALDSLWELMENCWQQQVEMRPTASDLVEQLTGPVIGAKSASSTRDWDEEFSSKFHRLVRAEIILPSIAQIEHILF